MWPFSRKPKPLKPESDWVVSVDDDGIAVVDHKGNRRSLAWADMTGLAVETNDNGPWGTDFWWLFFGPDTTVALGVPLGATGEAEMVDRLVRLPGFDMDAHARAVGSTANATFRLWRRPD